MIVRLCGFLGVFIIFPPLVFAQSARLQSIVMVTDDLDSLTRALTRQGFTVQPGRREPVGIFTDEVIFPNGTSVIIEHPSVGEVWRREMLQYLGRPFVSELRFTLDNPDSLRQRVEAAGIAIVLIDSLDPSLGFAIDSTTPLVIVFTRDSARTNIVTHPRGYYRIDWVILGASEDVEQKLRALFAVAGFRKRRQGCCDYWRAGSSEDLTYMRFEQPQAPWRGETNWLSIGKNALYFAYH
jgi:hypothetical protein